MACRSGSDLADDAAETFLNELLEGPSCAVTCQHGEVVDMDLSLSVSFCDLIVVDLGEPVVRCDRTGVTEDQSAYAVGNSGVLLNTPVIDLQIVIYDVLIVQHRISDVTDLLTVLSVKDVCLCNIRITCFGQDLLDAILNIFYGNHIIFDLRFKITGNTKCQHVDHTRVILLIACYKCLFDSCADLRYIKIYYFSVSL